MSATAAVEREMNRCDREIAQVLNQPVGQPAYLTTLGEMDWRREKRLIEQEQAAPLLTRAEMEARRMAALKLFDAGARQSEIARRFGVSRTTASRWRKAIDAGGVAALKLRKAPGRPLRFDWLGKADEIRALYESGSRFDRTGVGFALLLWGQYGVRYDPDHVLRILRAIGLVKRRRQAAAAAGGAL